ncbi:hypothetical protein ON010_g9102 [Phytophthora cinnamomi]|nr:hypothetical protein ON010_g9102 [Phytophthora cinnamomi]
MPKLVTTVRRATSDRPTPWLLRRDLVERELGPKRIQRPMGLSRGMLAETDPAQISEAISARVIPRGCTKAPERPNEQAQQPEPSRRSSEPSRRSSEPTRAPRTSIADKWAPANNFRPFGPWRHSHNANTISAFSLGTSYVGIDVTAESKEADRRLAGYFPGRSVVGSGEQTRFCWQEPAENLKRGETMLSSYWRETLAFWIRHQHSWAPGATNPSSRNLRASLASLREPVATSDASATAGAKKVGSVPGEADTVAVT